MTQRYQFICSNGCGNCGVKLFPFEYSRTETMDGSLVESKTHPMIVSTCCNSEVDIWDDIADDITGHTATTTTTTTAQAAQPVQPGWKLVPIEPTQDMITAYLNQSTKFQSAREDWAAMLSAAPTQEQGK